MRRASPSALALLALLAGALLAGCASMVAAPRPDLGPQAGACRPYANNPEPNKVYRIPPSPRCSIETIALAVHDRGEFRRIYGAEQRRTRDPASPSFVAPSSVIDPVIERLKAQAATLTCDAAVPNCPAPTLRILIFAHGGLVSHNQAVMSAEALAPGMLADGYAPVFLVWNSDMATSYGDRLCCVSEGRENKAFATFFAPVRVAGDLGASLARAPESYGQQVIRFHQSDIQTQGSEYFLGLDDITRPSGPQDAHSTDHDSICAALGSLHCPTIVYPPFTDYAHLNAIDQKSELGAANLLGFPARAVTTALASQVGAAAWANMLRRTRLATELPMTRTRQRAYQDNIALEDCATATKAADEAARQWTLNKRSHFKLNGEGGFSIFLDRLQCEIDQRNFVAGGRPVRVELYFFGHSMGALVGNELLWRHPDLPWRRIVYMAAATSVRDFRLTVAPMLECPATAGPGSAAASKPCRANVHFYGLMLHPLADAHELGAYGLVPQGSLLEWVDEMFGHAASKDDRMFGKWANVEDTLSLLPPDTRDRMFFRVFPAQQRMRRGDEAERRAFGLECVAATIGPAAGAPAERCTPVAHGQFTDYSFWRPDFLCRYGNPCAALDAEPVVDPAASPPPAGLSAP